MFPLIYFDEHRCALRIDALTNYRYNVDEETKEFSDEPLHDWASHAADAFGYMAVALKEPKPKRGDVPRKSRVISPGRVQPGYWMG